MKIRGFGKKTIEKYSDDVLEIVRTYISDDKNLRIHTSEFSENVKDAKTYSVEQIRQTYPRAYMEWSNEEDARLRKEYMQGKKISELAKIFQRNQGAIRSRLKKLMYCN